MKHDDEYKDEELPVKASGKGFYVALAVCLVAVCGVAVATFAGGLSKAEPQTQTTRALITTTAVQQVVIPATDVKDDRTTTTAMKTTASVPQTTTTAGEALFVFPASNTVVLPYSAELIYSETLGSWNTHNGVDFAAEAGSTVKAPAGGTVKQIYEDPLWGHVIEIDHGGKVISRCCGVTVQGIKVGDTVKAGQTIGTVSEIPCEIVGATHVHVEIVANDKYVDPLLLIRGKTVTAATTTVTSK
ncbi:MAG: M23 family metallopeptidase [Clostridia bacterium]|nr:M23 family metallopeptidase [Clostridia bacterium]